MNNGGALREKIRVCSCSKTTFSLAILSLSGTVLFAWWQQMPSGSRHKGALHYYQPKATQMEMLFLAAFQCLWCFYDSIPKSATFLIFVLCFCLSSKKLIALLAVFPGFVLFCFLLLFWFWFIFRKTTRLARCRNQRVFSIHGLYYPVREQLR